jgi:hypothetical protein
MGKIILEFDSYEEKEEAQTALNAEDWKCAMWEFDAFLRETVHSVSIINPKTGASDLEIEIAEKLRKKLRGILNDNGLTL